MDVAVCQRFEHAKQPSFMNSSASGLGQRGNSSKKTSPGEEFCMKRLDGCRVLVAEDEPLVAMLLEDALLEAGAIILGPAATVRHALDLTMTARPDIAVLDLNLSGESCLRVADALAAAGVAFVVATGYGDAIPLPQHPAVESLQKPYDPQALIDTLAKLRPRD
jgi:DNA-binding NtrC family response regulator